MYQTLPKGKDNLFELYEHICGESEVPPTYHFWSAVSLIAAVVENRVWVQKFAHSKLYPNLFILLIGPSGLGKGTAIEHALRLQEHAVVLNKYRGKLTAAHLTDYMGKTYVDDYGRQLIAKPRLWLVMDELMNDLGHNVPLIRDFLSLMTEIYTATNYPIQVGTRTHGEVILDCPVLNWLAGTTEDDLREILTPKLLRTGFTARTCFVFGYYDFGKRMPRVKYPRDYKEVFERLCIRLQELSTLEGLFTLTEQAEARLDQWYCTRPNPDDSMLSSSWKRQHDMLLKFAMVLSMADGLSKVISHKHVSRAIQMVDMSYQSSASLITMSTATQESMIIRDVAQYIEKKGSIKHGVLSSYMRQSRNMSNNTFMRCIMELQRSEMIQVIETNVNGVGRKGLVYQWIEGRSMVGKEDEEE